MRALACGALVLLTAAAARPDPAHAAATPAGGANIPESPAAVSRTRALHPFSASFDVSWRGITAGHSTLELRRAGDDAWEYRSRHYAGGIFRLMFPHALTQESRFELDRHEVRPVAYRADDGSGRIERSVSLEFDWPAARVRGAAEGKPVDLPLPAGTQDDMSVQVALMLDLRAGRVPPSFRLMNKDEIEEYDYAADGNETLDTPVGRFDTVIYRSHHKGSSRTTRLWLAPALGYLPLRAEQTRHDKVEFAMRIQSYQPCAKTSAACEPTAPSAPAEGAQ